ncbi:MAG: BREX-1 system adenine-specific DNA-methyltransferase PglX, partial [Candidatus Thiodiazotropha sp. (ex Lucinoma kastoroae)]|nr:BREX-1 system adenine-specific DNA-methyltransferase PglX [Candidatus Thiodiazotropha sp. (ex Lucinoma kastoroae)]
LKFHITKIYGGQSYTKEIRSEEHYFKRNITWSTLSSSTLSMRYSPPGFLFESKGSVGLSDSDEDLYSTLTFGNSNVINVFLHALSPTLDFNAGPVGSCPVIAGAAKNNSLRSDLLIHLSKDDWDFNETSWDFTSLPLLQPDYRQPTLRATYQKLRAHWREMTLEIQGLEEENNRIFIEAYGLQDELKPEVPLNEITLTCNPHYRYNGDKNEEELEALLLADTMRELVSYAVGCMFGRYSLDAPGLIIANKDDGLYDYWRIVKEGHKRPEAISNQPSIISSNEEKTENCVLMADSFVPDDDNVIPMLDGDWFIDDITERFFKFLRITFGEEDFEENLKFIEQAIGKTIRKYFLKNFYNDHVKRYKKRPIYWLFSSPKGSFNALIYMHRYGPDTVSVVLNDYLREFRTKLTSRKDHLEAVSISASAPQGEKTKALKEIEKLNKMIREMEEYERDVLYPLATEQVKIDLDDGVKVNYPKFGAALKKIPGLSVKGK